MVRGANYFLIESAVGALGIAQQMGEISTIIDPDDSRQMRKHFKHVVVPYVDEWSDSYRNALKLSLAYYLHKPQYLEKALNDLQDLDMPAPVDTTLFFSLMYDALYPGEDWRSVDTSDLVENNDSNEMIRVKQP